MVCKYHNKWSTSAYIHVLHQPNHILPCKYSGHIFHAVIKPRTITQMKAQKHSNTFQMQEQKGKFNRIITCSVTQYRNFKLISIFLEGYKFISIRGQPDINAILNQFVKEESISPQFAEVYNGTAKEWTENPNMKKNCSVQHMSLQGLPFSCNKKSILLMSFAIAERIVLKI